MRIEGATNKACKALLLMSLSVRSLG